MHFSRFLKSIGAQAWRAAAAAFLALALGLACDGAAAAAGSRPAARGLEISRGENLLRLHVVAHSDAPRDQEAKLKVRDALLVEMAGWGSFASRAEVEAWVRANEERLVQTARKALLREGLDLPVRVETGEFHFPEKRTGELILPAGEYRAVKVVIGDGAGQNWWCVLFPPLCFVEEEEERPLLEAAPSSGGPLPALFAAGVPGAAPASSGDARTDWALDGAGASPGAPGQEPAGMDPGGSEGGGGGESSSASAGVRWRLRLWEKLSQTAYAARLREMMELAGRSLRDEAL